MIVFTEEILDKFEMCRAIAIYKQGVFTGYYVKESEYINYLKVKKLFLTFNNIAYLPVTNVLDRHTAVKVIHVSQLKYLEEEKNE